MHAARVRLLENNSSSTISAKYIVESGSHTIDRAIAGDISISNIGSSPT